MTTSLAAERAWHKKSATEPSIQPTSLALLSQHGECIISEKIIIIMFKIGVSVFSMCVLIYYVAIMLHILYILQTLARSLWERLSCYTTHVAPKQNLLWIFFPLFTSLFFDSSCVCDFIAWSFSPLVWFIVFTFASHSHSASQLPLMLNLRLFVLICLHLIMENSRTARTREMGEGGLRQTCVYIFCSCINWKLHVNLRLVVLAFWFSYTSDRRQAAFVRSSTIRVIGEWNITNIVSFRFKWIFFNFIFFLLLLILTAVAGDGRDGARNVR